MGIIRSALAAASKSLGADTDRSPTAMAKDTAELVAEGGWEVMFGVAMTEKANDIWRKYSSAEYERAYEVCSAIFACVRTLMIALPEAKLQIGIVDADDEFQALPTHWLLDVLKKPNDEMSYADLVQHHIMHLSLTGSSYIVERRNDAFLLDGLLPFPTSWVKVVRDKREDIVRYEVWQGKNQSALDVLPSNMCVQLLPHPQNPGMGFGPMQAAARDYQTDDERHAYMVEMMSNIRVPGIILKQPEAWDPEQQEAIRNIFHDRVRVSKRGGPIFLEGEGAGVEMVSPLADLDWPGLTNLTEARICAAFGIPAQVVGLRVGQENATYSNFQEANRAFYTMTVVPTWKAIAEAWTRSLITTEPSVLEERLEFRFDWTDVEHLQEDEDRLSTRVTGQWTSGIISRNEARLSLGKDALSPEIGDVILSPAGMIETPITISGEDHRQQQLGLVKGPNADWDENQSDEDGEEVA